ncbi:MAG TPA: bifunctional diaminohydroxyphosphoribosylaminopyrimidine deaminase/5-amino-6-(5-phosphoribosylamino)uracil reductase RibD [bacterium]|nr:bifunctional diaminohydroxyphosphoribosylaminopyrimidine deaminase/5-amino-6-(5-phosphoribosylamino)uracil reductase RibD [bacterium]
MTATSDEAFLRRALELAEKARGRTAPNPIVGAVVVRDGRVIGEGYHQRAGAPHAEAEALQQAGAAAKDATLYVTLEPCTHQGRTPPCVTAILQAGIARVVSAMDDPDPRVAGKGHAELRAAGVQVTSGCLETEAAEANAEYLHRVKTGRVFGVLKAAISLDGRLAAPAGEPRWITGELARARAHELRDRYDAILVGRNTLEMDDPRLDVRIAGERRNPVAIVLDSRLQSPPHRKLWERARSGAQVMVAAVDPPLQDRARALREAGIEVLSVRADHRGQVDLAALFEMLAQQGLNSVLVEGGGKVHTSLLSQRLAQRIHLFVAPMVLGGDGPRLTAGLDSGVRIGAQNVETLGQDLLITGRIHSTPRPVPRES